MALSSGGSTLVLMSFLSLWFDCSSHRIQKRDDHALKILFFSDVHGACFKSPADFLNSKNPTDSETRFEAFKASLAGTDISTSKADVIVFGGDATTIADTITCDDRGFKELDLLVSWLIELKTPTIFLPGNHDVCLDERFVYSSSAKAEKRDKLLKKMETGRIFFTGAASAFTIGTATNKKINLLAAGFSAGRHPGVEKTPGASPGEDEVWGNQANGQLGAFQYCMPRDETSYLDCNDIYTRAVRMFNEAAGTLKGGADVVVLHGPPDNVGSTFGGEMGKLANAVSTAVDEKNGFVVIGHIHGAHEWGIKANNKEGQPPKFEDCTMDNDKKCYQMKNGKQTKMTFSSVKKERPEICETEESAEHKVYMHEFTDVKVGDGVDVVVTLEHKVVNNITMEVTRNWEWTAKPFAARETGRKYKAVSVTRMGKVKKVFQPELETTCCEGDKLTKYDEHATMEGDGGPKRKTCTVNPFYSSCKDGKTMHCYNDNLDLLCCN